MSNVQSPVKKGSKTERFNDSTLTNQQPDLSDKLSLLKSRIQGAAIDTVDKFKKFQSEPTSDNAAVVISKIEQDRNLPQDDKALVISGIREILLPKFSFDNCPTNYHDLKQEAKILAGINQFSFLLMAQRLKKIRDEKLYTQDGYKDFKEFIHQELNIVKQSVYNYIGIVEEFGVQTFGLHDNIEPSKLLPFLPILKSEKDNIPKDKIREKVLNEINRKSARMLQDEAEELKIKYGLVKKASAKNRFNRKIDLFMNDIRKNLRKYDRAKLKEMISEISVLMRKGA